MSTQQLHGRHHQNRTVVRRQVIILLAVLLSLVIGINATGDIPKDRELQRLRNQGTAHYENQDYNLAVPIFEKCVGLAKESAADWVNLGLAYYKTLDYEKAIAALKKARQLNPDYLHSSYVLGLIYKKTDSLEKAIDQFEKVISSDPADAPSYYSLGVVYNRLGQDEKAQEAFRATVRHNPNHPSAHYYLFKYAKAQGRTDEAKREMKIFSELRKAIPDRQRTESAFEEGPYLKPIIPPRQSFVPSGTDLRRAISFHDITSHLPELAEQPAGKYERKIPATQFDEDYAVRKLLPQVGGGAVLVDLDGDADRDIYLVRCADAPEHSENKLYLNDGKGTFADATAASGTGDQGLGTGVAVGDFDNDGAIDIYVLNYGANVLLQSNGDGTFTDVTRTAGVGDTGFAKQAVFFDYDHDGDLDLLVVNYCDMAFRPVMDTVVFPSDFPGQQNILYRNNGDSTFTVIDDSLWAARVPARTASVAFGDCDDDDDTDLLLVNEDSPCRVHLNQRGGRFTSAESLGETGAYQGDWSDFDNDGDLDVILIRSDGVFLFLNDSKAQFAPKELMVLNNIVSGARTTELQLLDFDNDGLLDILIGAEDGKLFLLANDGSGNFSLFSENLISFEGVEGTIVSLDAGDVDNDGDVDILGAWSGGVPFLLENRGGESANWLEVEPVGQRISKQGIGSKLEVKTGPYYQRRDVTEWPVHFGLGVVDRVEVLRITWTNGIVQNMVSVPIRQKFKVEEIVRTDASCPFLFAFDGEKFNYVNDILGVAAMGVPFDEGIYHIPDPDEYVKIKGKLLTEFDNRYLLRLCAELKEIVFLDQARLLVIDHPADVEVYPNERFSEPPFIEPGIHTVKNKRYPISAKDRESKDILPLITREDLRYPADIPMTAYDGLAERHWIELDLGDLEDADRIMLYLTGWIYWSSASVNVAVSQNDRVMFEAVSLAVPDTDGEWVTVINDIGLPNGKNSTIPVDLSSKFLSDDYRLRLSTNLVVYWDEIFFTVDEPAIEVKQSEAPLLSADLHYRGFSTMSKNSLGLEFFDYHRVERFGPWRQHAGRYTRYGPVTELLSEIDDRYVIYGPGEEISLVYNASQIPSLPTGWKRDFFFYAFGWIKDGDPNTVHSETVKPLPFRGMPGYPYEPIVHPRAVEIEQNLAEYLTRETIETVGQLRRKVIQ
ncbi:MAG: FG-GAP-like repeat-containing protein [Candidatus Zixiibacteriota bacterium]